MLRPALSAIVIPLLIVAHARSQAQDASPHRVSPEHVSTPIERDDEPRLRNLRKLTAGGENAEAYWLSLIHI